MFFLLSKLMAFLITPLVWIILLFIIGLRTQDEIRKRKCFRWSIGLLLFFSNAFILDECMRIWEIPATKYEDVKTYDVGIVLGGMSQYDPSLGRAQFYRGVDRLIQAVDLYRLGKIKKIVFTGGSGSILHPELKEGNYVNRYLVLMGIPQKDFLIESESQNTHENATLTKALFEKEHIKGSCLMITSAFHMRRGLGCFNKIGIYADPYSTDRYAGPRKFEFDHLFIPNTSAMNDWNNFIHELFGFFTYKIMGYT